MKYYLHDTSAFEDEKVSELFIEFGYEGVGLFYVILEKLGKQEKPIKTSVLKAQLKVGKKLEKCWKFMEEIEIISSNNDETFNKQLLNFSESYKIKSEKNAKRILQWREKQEIEKNVTCSESVRNASKVKVSKVKVSKGNIEENLLQVKDINICKSDFEKLNDWMKKYTPTVCKLKTQLTEENLTSLKSKYTSTLIAEKLADMENKADLLKKYSNVNLTLIKWLKPKVLS